jgi:hypothetical protein
MSEMRRGFAPRSCARRGLLISCLLPALIGGGCAQNQSYNQPNWYAGGPVPQQAAAAVPIPVEMEDDGRPAQVPPRVDGRPTADDPTQPWSPNYGGPANRSVRRPVQVSQGMVRGHSYPASVAGQWRGPAVAGWLGRTYGAPRPRITLAQPRR